MMRFITAGTRDRATFELCQDYCRGVSFQPGSGLHGWAVASFTVSEGRRSLIGARVCVLVGGAYMSIVKEICMGGSSLYDDGAVASAATST